MPLFSDSDAETTGWRAVLQVQDAAAKESSATAPGDGAEQGQIRRALSSTSATHTGAARAYKLDHLRFKVWEMVEAARVVYFDALFLTVSVDSVKYVAEHCAKMGNTFCLNLTALHICRYFYERVLTVLPFTDFVFGNEAEYLALADHRKHDMGKDIDSVVTWLAKQPRVDGDSRKRRHIVVTCGQQPTIVASTWRGFGVKVRRYQVPPVRPGRYVSKDGAGDAFAGGFLYALLHEADVDSCVLQGLYAARVAVQRTGPRFDFRDRPPLQVDRPSAEA
jgi:adenosine kinase